MHTFKVVKESNGWAVRLGEGMTTPFWSRKLAVMEADRLCAALRRHGEGARVVIDPNELGEAPRTFDRFAEDRLKAFGALHAPRRP
jgi:hypothetical protein